MVFPGNILVPILTPRIYRSNHILLADFPSSLPQRLFWNIWYAPCIFGTTASLDRGRSDRVVVLRACRNSNGLSNYFKSITIPKRLQIVIIQCPKLDLLGIPKLVRLAQILFSGFQLPQLGAVARQVVLDHVMVWKKLGCFFQQRFGFFYTTPGCPALCVSFVNPSPNSIGSDLHNRRSDIQTSIPLFVVRVYEPPQIQHIGVRPPLGTNLLQLVIG